MGLVRLFQVSDLHLGRPFGWLPPDRRAERRRDQRSALERAVRESIERGVHGILIPGDLFDLEGVDADTLAFTLEAFNVAGCPPVFIAPGNHDPYFPGSLTWNSRLLIARGRQWPAHVRVFTSERWTSFDLPGVEGVRIWGRVFTSSAVSMDRPLAAASLPAMGDTRRVEIGLFHGSREGAGPPGAEVTAPFSDAEALASPFTYLAVGHYHQPSTLAAASSGGARLTYAGSAVGLDLGETGAHGGAEVRIEHGRRQPFIEIEPVRLDRRAIHGLTVDVTRCSSADAVDRRIEKALDDARVTDEDLAEVNLTGRLPRDIRYRPAARLAERVFHLRVREGKLRKDYDLQRYRDQAPTTTEERFAHTLLERLDASSDPTERATLEAALYHGLDAFCLAEAVPADEALE